MCETIFSTTRAFGLIQMVPVTAGDLEMERLYPEAVTSHNAGGGEAIVWEDYCLRALLV